MFNYKCMSSDVIECDLTLGDDTIINVSTHICFVNCNREWFAASFKKRSFFEITGDAALSRDVATFFYYRRQGLSLERCIRKSFFRFSADFVSCNENVSVDVLDDQSRQSRHRPVCDTVASEELKGRLSCKAQTALSMSSKRQRWSEHIHQK